MALQSSREGALAASYGRTWGAGHLETMGYDRGRSPEEAIYGTRYQQ